MLHGLFLGRERACVVCVLFGCCCDADVVCLCVQIIRDPIIFREARHKVFRGGWGRGPPNFENWAWHFSPPKKYLQLFFWDPGGSEKKTGQTVDFPITILCYVRRNKEPDWSESPQSQWIQNVIDYYYSYYGGKALSTNKCQPPSSIAQPTPRPTDRPTDRPTPRQTNRPTDPLIPCSCSQSHNHQMQYLPTYP